jgi:hypothetical protein
MQDFLARAFAASALCILSVAYAVGAEQPTASSAPRGLAPPVVQQPLPQAEDMPQDVMPEAPQTSAPVPAEEAVPDQPGQPRGPKVMVSALEDLDPSGAGLIDETSGGLPSGIYAGSPRAAIVSRISQLNPVPPSPVLQSLQRRILLSTTKPPAGVTPVDEPSMLAQRLRRLIAGGRVGEVAMLGAQSPRDDRFARQTWAEALLLQGRDDDACGDATSLRQSLNEPFWIELRAYCYLIADDMSAATLTLDVMRERANADATFLALASVLTDGAKVKIDALPAPGALQVALLRRTRIAVPASLAGWLPARQVFLGGADPLARLVAVERSFRAGLASPEDLVGAYKAAVFSPDQIDDPDAAVGKLNVAQGNALYFQALLARSQPAARAAMFAASLDRADAQNNFPFFAQATRQVARQMPAVPETAWLAPQILRVLLYNGDVKAAGQWLGMLTSPTDVATVNALRIHAAIVYPSAENTAALPQALAWLGSNGAPGAGGKPWLTARALREVPLLNALGYTIPPEAQWAVTGEALPASLQGAAGDATRSLARTAQQQRVGETVLNVLVALGRDGPARAPVGAVVRAVDALSTIGMRDEARAIAAEAVLGSPLRQSK